MANWRDKSIDELLDCINEIDGLTKADQPYALTLAQIRARIQEWRDS